MVSLSAYSVNDFISSEGVETLIEILEHQNPDIAIESVVILSEITE
jgi:hypothetical protein